ncbi:MAG: hypothetical protein WCI71_01295 [Bacteroidota bacterium]
MKKSFKYLLFPLIIFCFMGFAQVALAADPVPPPPGQHGQTGNQAPGAPIDGGLGILLAMGAAYGGKKLYHARKDKKDKEQLAEDQTDL